MKKLLSFLTFLLIFGIAIQVSAMTIINGSFEDQPPILDGWHNSGITTALIAPRIQDANGTYYYPTDPSSSPSFFAELRGNGAYISQDLSWLAGETINFDWNYLNFDGSAFDSGFFEISGASDPIEIATISEVGSNSTGWQTFSYTFLSDSTSGSYIKFGVDSNLSYDSGWNTAPILLIDNVSTPVPVPASLLLLGSGLLGIIGARRKV